MSPSTYLLEQAAPGLQAREWVKRGRKLARHSHPTVERRAIRIPDQTRTRVNPGLFPRLTQEAHALIAAGILPDLTPVLRAMPRYGHSRQGECRALDLRPLMESTLLQMPQVLDRIGSLPENKVTLVDHPQLRVLLIHWPAGKASAIHGHAFGGGVFKVLQGELMEHRYTPDDRQQWMSSHLYRTGQMASIDDATARHAVKNPRATPAVSLHVYSPGRLLSNLRIDLSGLPA